MSFRQSSASSTRWGIFFYFPHFVLRCVNQLRPPYWIRPLFWKKFSNDANWQLKILQYYSRKLYKLSKKKEFRLAFMLKRSCYEKQITWEHLTHLNHKISPLSKCTELGYLVDIWCHSWGGCLSWYVRASASEGGYFAINNSGHYGGNLIEGDRGLGFGVWFFDHFIGIRRSKLNRVVWLVSEVNHGSCCSRTCSRGSSFCPFRSASCEQLALRLFWSGSLRREISACRLPWTERLFWWQRSWRTSDLSLV